MSIINGRKVLLKSLVGSHNYNLNTESSDYDYKLFVAPTFEDLYSGQKYSKQVVTETEDYSVHDVRKLTELLFKSNINFLEVFSSNNMSINSDEMVKLYGMREDIFRMNLPTLFHACRGMHIQKMALLGKGTEGTQHLVDEFGYDTKQATHAYRCLNFIVRFEATGFNDFDSAIRYEGEDLEFMKSIRNGFFEREVFENFISHYFQSTFIKMKSKYENQPVNMELKEEMDRLIMNAVKINI